MLGEVDHVGYLARDFEDGLARMVELTGAPLVRRFERPQYSLLGAYLGSGDGHIEVFAFTDPALAAERLDGAELRLDHVAYDVADIDEMFATMRRGGVKFAGPDLREEMHEPVDLGGVRHAWTIPSTCLGQSLQLMQR